MPASYPLCTDCRWVVMPDDDYSDPTCSSPRQPMSVVDGQPRWRDCHIQREEGEGEDNIRDEGLCGSEGRYFEPKEPE